MNAVLFVLISRVVSKDNQDNVEVSRVKVFPDWD